MKFFGHGTLQSHCARMRAASVPRLNYWLLPTIRLGKDVVQGIEERNYRALIMVLRVPMKLSELEMATLQ